jgi:transposase
VFVGPLAHEEAVALKRRAEQAKHCATRERAAIVLASDVGTAVPPMARMWMTGESHVREVIHEFKERGMASLDADVRGGRPRRITGEQRRAAVAVAGARPDRQGVALTRCSLPRLADHLVEARLVEISAAASGSRADRGRAVVFSARARGRPVRTPTMRPRPRGCWN